MNDLMHIATVELVRFLAGKLPEVSADWWQKHVYHRLTFQQQRMVKERDQRTLQHLDLAGLLRVFQQNWVDLSQTTRLPREGLNWVKELQMVRNKRAHLSAEVLPASETYRDADTLGRLLKMIGAGQASLYLVEEAKAAAVAEMGRARGSSADVMPSRHTGNPKVTESKLGIPKETPNRRSDMTSQTTAEALLDTIERHGGYSAIELAHIVKGPLAAQPQVNGELHKLMRRGLVERRGVGGGKLPYRYYRTKKPRN
ncbi:unnamed protein product [uncultured bacterium]|nr:unnamed protein product [uncultured bacterium]